MNKTIKCKSKSGSVLLPASKSLAHRYLICAAQSDLENKININSLSDDIKATARCLNALFNNIYINDGFIIAKVPELSKMEGNIELFCGESGTTLRLLLPLVGALGVKAVFLMEGRLPERPIKELGDVLESGGMKIEKSGDKLFCSGRLNSGEYEIAGDVSSQYISALLLALPLLSGDSVLRVTGTVQSKDYILMTENTLRLSGIKFSKEGYCYKIYGNQRYAFPCDYTAEGDWSGAAAFLCMGALSKGGISVSALDINSLQGDKRLVYILKEIGADVKIEGSKITVKRGSLHPVTVDAGDIPDVVPCLSALLAAIPGKSMITNAKRLKLKESDRLFTTANMLNALGADVKETEEGLIINGNSELEGGLVKSFNDHRIAMAAAVAASACKKAVIIDNKDCVNKSYVGFWKDLESLEAEQ